MDTFDQRLRHAREDAGFPSVKDAVEAHGWTYSTYAGHENGHRQPKMHDVQKYAKAFRCSESWLLTGRGTTVLPKIRRPGFSEPDVVPYHAPSEKVRLGMEKLAGALAPGVRHVMLYTITRSYPSLMMRANDVMIVDLNTLDPEPGSIVVTRLVNEQTQEDRTLLRLKTRDGTTPAYSETPPAEDEIEGVVGTVVSLMRPAV